MSKWERVSKMKFKHENVHLVPYPYICTLYLELNSFQQNFCGKSPWLCLGNFRKHPWSMSRFSLFLRLLYLNRREQNRVWRDCTVSLKYSVTGCSLLSRIAFPWIFRCLSSRCWLFSRYFYEAVLSGSQPSFFNVSHRAGASTYVYTERVFFFLALDYVCRRRTSHSLLLFS